MFKAVAGFGALALLIMLVSHTAVAQSGKLVDAVAVQLSDEALTRLAAFEPTIRDIVAQVDVKAITYLSDGLRVKGYLAAPKCSGPPTVTLGTTNKAKMGPDSRPTHHAPGPHSRPTDPHSRPRDHKQPIETTFVANT